MPFAYVQLNALFLNVFALALCPIAIASFTPTLWLSVVSTGFTVHPQPCQTRDRGYVGAACLHAARERGRPPVPRAPQTPATSRTARGGSCLEPSSPPGPLT